MPSVRILYQHTTLADGAEGVHIDEMVEAFRRFGHDVQVIGAAARQAGGGAPPNSTVARIRRALPRGAYELAQLALSSVRCSAFARHLRALGPDLVYKRHARYDWGPICAARRLRIPLILEVNCVYSSPELRQFEPLSFTPLLRAIERWIFTRADLCLAVSTPLRQELHAVAPRAAVVVVPNGANPDRFVPHSGDVVRSRLQLGNRIVVGFVGTLWRWHGLELLFRALARLERQDLHLLVVGDGQMRAELEELARTLGIEDRTTLTGKVPHDQMPDYLAAMDVTVLPAERRRHASPMKVLEYMAMAKPTVAPGLPNVEEILTDGIDGVLFAPDDESALAEALRSLLDDEVRRVQLGANARRKVEQSFNWNENARRVTELAQGLLSESRCRA
jgi:glycosyltransferase involved in cell wall biosynthesis